MAPPDWGQDVTQCCVDYAFSMEFSNGFLVRIEAAFSYTSSDGSRHRVDPQGDPPGVAPALAVVRLSVRGGVAFHDGRLDVTFSDDSVLRVPGGGQYEVWEMAAHAGEGLKVVSIPGGELAIWRPVMRCD